MRFTSIQKLVALLVVLVVAAMGTYLLVSSRAATPYASTTAASGSLTGGAQTVQNCSGASTGSCVIFQPTLNSVARIIYSMEAPGEGLPHGVPSSYSWQSHPVVDYPMPPSGWTAMTAWGQIYADATTVEPTNIRIEIKNMESYVWSISAQKWVRMQAYEQITGAHYLEDFSTNNSIPADLRTEPDGGISTTMVSDRNFHFYPPTEANLPDPTDIGGVFTTYQARLILDDPAGPNNIAQARYLANVGTDWWKSVGSAYGGSGVNNIGVGEGRFTYLSDNWQAEDFYSGGPEASGVTGAWTEAQLEANPPPLDGMGAP